MEKRKQEQTIERIFDYYKQPYYETPCFDGESAVLPDAADWLRYVAVKEEDIGGTTVDHYRIKIFDENKVWIFEHYEEGGYSLFECTLPQLLRTIILVISEDYQPFRDFDTVKQWLRCYRRCIKEAPFFKELQTAFGDRYLRKMFIEAMKWQEEQQRLDEMMIKRAFGILFRAIG